MLPLALAFAIVAQTPQPFPKPGTAKPAPTAPATPASPPATQTVLPPQQSGAPGANDVPTETSLGVPIYPGAEFLTSFDATRGQRYYLFGSNSAFAEIVNYYKQGSAYYAPSAAVLDMVAAILHDKKKILPCAVYLEGEYGYEDLFIGVDVQVSFRQVGDWTLPTFQLTGPQDIVRYE